MALNFEISEVRLHAEETYLVFVRLSVDNVSAVFEVTLSARRKRRGRQRELKHHKKTFEILHNEAKMNIARFCQKLSESLKGPGTNI